MERREISGLEPSLLGYGGMRYPLDRETKKIDREKAADLIRRAMEAGINYYDTAWTYHEGESESFLGQALKEYPRESYYLATKLPCWLVDSREKAEELFHTQLERLDRDYVDFYLLHSLSRRTWTKMVELKIPSLLEEYQRQGKIRKLGFSFHDDYEVFEEILRFRHWDFCQIQLNYMDTEHQAGLKGLELARGLGVPVVVMEPVKGGTLANVPEEVTKLFKSYNPEASVPSWAIRFAASLPNVKIVLSGMSDMDQLLDNTSYMQDLKPLNDEEKALIKKATDIINASIDIPCTGCSYCTDGCPMQIAIPKYFSLYNADMQELRGRGITPDEGWTPQGEYYENVAKHFGKASACIQCGQCEGVCPQHLPIIEYLQTVAKHFERE